MFCPGIKHETRVGAALLPRPSVALPRPFLQWIRHVGWEAALLLPRLTVTMRRQGSGVAV